MRSRNVAFVTLLLLCAPAYSVAQQKPASEASSVPIYRVTVVGRTIKAINYGHRGEPTKIGFQGTVLLPKAKGEAQVQSKQGATQIRARFERMPAPTRFGAQYLTYVLWAITPEGRAVNLGELVLNDSDKGRLDVSTDLQAFGLLVTAEPYYSVTQPSNLVVMENVLRGDTVGKVEEIDAKAEFLNRGQPFTLNLEPEARPSGKKLSLDRYEAVLEIYQAQNAVQIARSEGADRYASDTLAKAEQLLQQAQSYQAQKMDAKQIVMTAREAAQAAEDARAITAKRKQELGQASEQKVAAQAQASRQAEPAPPPPAAPIAAPAAESPSVIQIRPHPMPVSAPSPQAALADQLNLILPIHESAGALKLNLYDHLFEADGAALTPVARDKLSRIAGIVRANPGLHVEVEGYTSGTSDQHLLSQRAAAVCDYFATNGILAESITARGITMRPPAGDRQVRHVTVVIKTQPDAGVSVSELGRTAPAPAGGR
ncbi:MAG TPA: OmpA family protein [Bryobacterales bacterium]|nr:OmpA family protein [Bryobacterales bacterium]